METSASVTTALLHVANKIWTKVKLITVKHFSVSVKRLLGQRLFILTVPWCDFSTWAAERFAAGYQTVSLHFVISSKKSQHRIDFFKILRPWWSFKNFLKCPMFEFRYSNILKTKFRSPICECLSRAHCMQLSMWKCTGKWWVSTWMWKSGWQK